MVVLRRTEKFEHIFSPTPFEFQQRTQPIQVSKKSPYLVSTASWPQKLNINFFRDGGSGSLHIQPLSFCQQLIIRIQIVSLVLSKNGLLLPFQELLFVRCEGYSLRSLQKS